MTLGRYLNDVCATFNCHFGQRLYDSWPALGRHKVRSKRHQPNKVRSQRHQPRQVTKTPTFPKDNNQPDKVRSPRHQPHQVTKTHNDRDDDVAGGDCHGGGASGFFDRHSSSGSASCVLGLFLSLDMLDGGDLRFNFSSISEDIASTLSMDNRSKTR